MPPARRRPLEPFNRILDQAALARALEALLAEYEISRAVGTLAKSENAGRGVRFFVTPEAERLIARRPELREFVNVNKRLVAAQLGNVDVVFHERNGRLSIDVTQLTNDGFALSTETFSRTRDLP